MLASGTFQGAWPSTKPDPWQRCGAERRSPDSGLGWSMNQRWLFVSGLLLLAAASVITWAALPSSPGKHPVLRWATDDNPERISQVAHFEKWLRRHRYPRFAIRLDFVNNDVTKDVIQGVSGDADDLMDVDFGSMDFMRQCGLLYNVAPAARTMGFGPRHTYKIFGTYLVRHGKQYMFPTNAGTMLYWVNKATFAKYHQPLPPRAWKFTEFQRRGLAFVRAGNSPARPQRVFFADTVDTRFMRRSLGLSVFNATLTRCMLNDPRYVAVLRLMYRWTFADHLLPTPAQQASFTTREGYGGSVPQLFNAGRFGLYYMGRWALIQFRKFYRTSGPMALAVSDPPYGQFPNAVMTVRGTAIYIGSPHKQLAEYFLAYLASRNYNMQIVRDGDAEPPCPVYAETRQFLRPRRYPNEWGCSGAFAHADRTIGIPEVQSPFVLAATVSRIVRMQAEAGFMAGIYTARQAARLAAKRINRHIARNIRQSQRLRRLYEKLLGRQKLIDRLRKAGRKIPLRLIGNPFYRRYYVARGWAR